jgi:hypothetical protein
MADATRLRKASKKKARRPASTPVASPGPEGRPAQREAHPAASNEPKRVARGAARATQTPAAEPLDETVRAWVRRGQELLALLEANGCASHEVRVDFAEGRFMWLAPDGHVSADARAEVVCTWSPTNAGLVMAWADPLVQGGAIPRALGTRPELDDVDEETAFRVAMTAAEASGAEYLYRMSAPHAAYFLALRELRFDPDRASFDPGTPVGLVLRELGETRAAIASGAEPADVVRARLAGVGTTLRQQAESAYRDTAFARRLERAGKRLEKLAERISDAHSPRAAEPAAVEWLSVDLGADLDRALARLEDEWRALC